MANWFEATRRAQADLQQTQLQVATGRRILSPADDPEGAARIKDLSQALDRVTVYQEHVEAVRRRRTLEEEALAGVTDVLERLRELTIRASSPALDASGRETIAVEVRELEERLLQLANTTDGQGEYLFAGSRTGTPAFASVNGQVVYNGDQSIRLVQIGDGRMVADGDPGDRVFMAVPSGNGRFSVSPAAGNAGTGVVLDSYVADPSVWSEQPYTLTFTGPGAWEATDGGGAVVASGTHVPGDVIEFAGAAVQLDGDPVAGDAFDIQPSAPTSMFDIARDLAAALETAAPGPVGLAELRNALNGAQGSLDQALDSISGTRTRVGTTLSSVDSQRDINDGLALELESTISTIRDLDYAEALSRLEMQLFGLDAAQKAFVQASQLGLFRFL